MLKKLIFIVETEIKQVNYPELFKNNVRNGIEKIKASGEEEKMVTCLANLAYHINDNPMIVRCEVPFWVFAKLSARLFAMYSLDKNVLNIDKSVIFEILNAMNNIKDESYKGATAILTNPIFIDPLVELNSNHLNYYTENARIIANELTSIYTPGCENDLAFIEKFMEDYAQKRLHPEVEVLAKVAEIKNMMNKTIANQDSLHPDWKPRFDAKKHLIDELDNMNGKNLKKFLQYDYVLKSNRCPAHHITNDELVVINITKCLNIYDLECDEIDALVDKVHALPLDQYSTALKDEIMASKAPNNNRFFKLENPEDYLENFEEDLEVSISRIR